MEFSQFHPWSLIHSEYIYKTWAQKEASTLVILSNKVVNKVVDPTMTKEY